MVKLSAYLALVDNCLEAVCEHDLVYYSDNAYQHLISFHMLFFVWI